jgi:hypothetical protein
MGRQELNFPKAYTQQGTTRKITVAVVIVMVSYERKSVTFSTHHHHQFSLISNSRAKLGKKAAKGRLE